MQKAGRRMEAGKMLIWRLTGTMYVWRKAEGWPKTGRRGRQDTVGLEGGRRLA
jgi:hypothetical protein